ncbi:LysM peptidoglycan-binding domain-containing protein [Candidatus Accumulibacter sp. ACC007]|uniref:lytic transglycosylase n=1 Tax=Candidatus Accumulibacter sp. ACC007 TaxID=2823333 RepID=UPI0025C60BCC|nr:LysM peptidoglycan-binding domain-containing protein [Candidatus Accumulibacter sp. ACC007]
MTPRIAFAIVAALACGSAWSNEAQSENLQSDVPALRSSARAEAATTAVPAGTDGPLPVIEVAAPAPLPETIDLTYESAEIFQHLRRGFAMPNISNSLVLHHQQWYLNRPDYLRRMITRSSRYLHFIIVELDKRGMPLEIALLPMVESAYNPTAYSRSHASGLWQFVPATGKQYKLEQNWWVDERRDIVASTGAALDYLQYIYELHGDWHLALASYNWGEGAVGRAIKKNEAQGLPTDYLSLKMPDETRNYVPKLQALKNIFSNPNILADLDMLGVPMRPYFATVTKTTNIDVKLAAKLAEMPVQDFVALNPSHNRPVIKSETPLVIPADKLETFNHNLEVHEESDKPLSSWQAYTLRPGERLEQVAPRFGMTVAGLKAANGIQGRVRLASGATLLVAGEENDPHDPAQAIQLSALGASSEPAPVVEKPAPVDKHAVTKADAPPAAPAMVTRTRTHKVGKGETLLGIAERYDMSLADLKQRNKLRSNQVNYGTRLTVVTSEPVRTAPVATAQRRVQVEVASKPAAPSGDAKPATGHRTHTHTVRRGETLFSIAQRYEMTVAELKQLNKLRSDQVTSGSKLLVDAPAAAEKLSSAKSAAEPVKASGKQDKAAGIKANVAKVSFTPGKNSSNAPVN